ncbi:HNH endonuclease signature motif containing protein [Tepidibacter hydrothermalis]|uniref:HNH endonuclease signature motif containing protein n=1 Tax=Tepidibacter hydrothermalis TaxID=3036126 RepID=A0ABY8E821_9FIRM|nr:HNH endonuclease signature motif containing protein [Tepidibacter hydrothermalis]WFD09022.1 HNH endonuclease signature motif containing protein [Tepidibacter hydrothermalis]
MRLVDFYKFRLFKKIRDEMGIPEGYKAKFQSRLSFKKIDIGKIETELIERGRGLDVSIENIGTGEDDTFEYKGKKVVVYIRDQYSYNSQYKFHVSWCKTICEMRDNGKLNRYVVSRRKDGTFFVNIIDKNSHRIIQENKISELKVCKHCLGELDYNGYSYAIRNEKNKIYEEFAIDEFLKKYDTKFKQLPRYTDVTAPLNEYPKKWSKISMDYRSYKNWICEDCGNDFSTNKKMLDVHHIDGNKYNVEYSNLKALCKECHGNQYKHGHYKKIISNKQNT